MPGPSPSSRRTSCATANGDSFNQHGEPTLLRLSSGTAHWHARHVPLGDYVLE